ncbi:ATP-binding protein [Nonomuraea candida]|uniref:ATP-binding protein n=1 Tax=Nonomuraea candida TaxID=359159 RepID=UPI0012F82B66|nr:ATP-binding protein [Nonomuraea candida]
MEALLRVDFDEKSLTPTRRAVLRAAGDQGMAGDRLGDFLLAVSECLVNALEHAGGRGRLRLWRQDGELVCDVSDTGPGIPAEKLRQAPLPPPGSPGGRGIWLMRRLADDVSFTTGSHGTVVRLRMRLPADHRAGHRADRAADHPAGRAADHSAEHAADHAAERPADVPAPARRGRDHPAR